MHLFVNALAASAGGGLTYIHNVIPELASRRELHITVAAASTVCEQFGNLANVDIVPFKVRLANRFWYEQSMLPGIIRRTRSDVLLSAGNIALRNSPVPQILLSRNSLYTSPTFYRDLLDRGEYRTWLGTRVRGMFARKSIHWAQVTVAPTEAFAADLRSWTRSDKIVAIHHGFDRETFTRDLTPLAGNVQEKLRTAQGAIKLLFVSHYNYYRNFETLILALPILRERLAGRTIKLLLTCRLTAGANPGPYRPEAAAKLARDLGIADMIVELGTIPHNQLHQLYRFADLYVTPAYAETFAHPLVESMSSGVPVIASDLPVHKEICGEAALYFSRFSATELGDRFAELANSPGLAARLSEAGLARAKAFSWRKHVDELLSVARSLSNTHDHHVPDCCSERPR
jgi:glycosyltransferase involved in cell wall biosynthesis